MIERLKLILPALFLFLALIMFFTINQEPRRSNSPTVVWILEIVGPVETLLTSSAQAVAEIIEDYFDLVNLKQENKALQTLLDSQGGMIVQLNEDRLANERLTKLLGLRQAYPNLVMQPAYIVAWDPGPWLRSVTISSGSQDGVALDQVVIHPTGVVGRVVAVSPNYAQVLLITDYNSSIDAVIQRTRDMGILSGQGAQTMILKYMTKNIDVRPGDQVVTSGLDGFFPRGLALGLVTRVNRGNPELFLDLEITSAVAFDQLEEVMVIINQSPPIDWLTFAPRLDLFMERGEGQSDPPATGVN